MRNICRPFILYNDFLPPAKEVHEDWQYMSFGYYDGISVGNNLLEENVCDLRALWEYYIQHGEKLKGIFASQIIFGLRSEEEECRSSVNDEDFWADDKKNDYPFLFISLLQLKKGEGGLKKEWSCHEALEETLNGSKDCKAITYLTFDSSDLILVLKCKKYSDGAGIIECFHCGTDTEFYEITHWNLKYSFTVAAIQKRFLNDNTAISGLKELIPSVYIHLIEKNPGSITDIQMKLKNKLGSAHVRDAESLLGCNDELIVLTNVEWGKFLELFQDVTGILNHSNEDYQDNLTGVTTIIGHTQARRVPVKVDEDKKGKGPDKTPLLTEKMRKRCAEMKVLDDYGSVCMRSIRRDLYQVLNSLHKFETTPFPDYLFQTVMLPLNMVIDMAEETIDQSQVYDFFESYYAFMKEFNLYVQNFSHSDRQFTQTPDFNIKIYNTPVRMIAFYNAFMLYLKRYLNDLDEEQEEKHRYELLACPGVTNNMQVLELFKKISRTKRLFLVEIPENQVYNPKVMLVMLAHEIAHFVGKKIRNREERFACAKKIAGQIIVKYMLEGLKEYCKDNQDEFEYIQNSEYWEKIQKKIINLLDEYMSDEKYEMFLESMLSSRDENEQQSESSREKREEFLEMMKERKNHSEVLRRVLSARIVELLREHRKELWGYILEQDFLFWLEKSPEEAEQKKANLEIEIQEIMRRFTEAYEWEENMFSAMSFVDLMIDLFKECIADLVAILTLKLSMKDYLNAVLQSAEDQGFGQDFSEAAIVIRSGLVTVCMNQKQEGEKGYCWNDEMLKEIDDTKGDALASLKIAILNFCEDYFSAKQHFEEEKNNAKNDIDMILDTDILKLMEKYLLESKRRFIQYNSDEKIVMQEKLIEIYRLFDTENITDLTLGMQEYIERYQMEIQASNQKYAQEEE